MSLGRRSRTLAPSRRQGIAAALQQGVSGTQVARDFGVSYPTAHAIKKSLGLVKGRAAMKNAKKPRTTRSTARGHARNGHTCTSLAGYDALAPNLELQCPTPSCRSKVPGRIFSAILDDQRKEVKSHHVLASELDLACISLSTSKLEGHVLEDSDRRVSFDVIQNRRRLRCVYLSMASDWSASAILWNAVSPFLTSPDRWDAHDALHERCAPKVSAPAWTKSRTAGVGMAA